MEINCKHPERKRLHPVSIYLMAVAFLFQACTQEAKIEVSHLRCEFMENPVGIDIANPSLSWEIGSDARGVKQTGYRVLVASSLEKLNADEGDLWDSQSVRSEQSTNVLYNGKSLASRTTCYWKVKTTTLNTVAAFVPPRERIITIEDTLEIQIRERVNFTFYVS